MNGARSFAHAVVAATQTAMLSGCAVPDPGYLVAYVARNATVGSAVEPAVRRFEADGYACSGLGTSSRRGECSRIRNVGLLSCIERITFTYAGKPPVFTTVQALVPLACVGGFG